MTIGSAMEEYNNSYKKLENNQWKQLFPDHLKNYALDGGKCICIIVSPDEYLSEDKYIYPIFIEKTDDIFNWNKENKYHIFSKTYDINIYIFNTMMPTKNINNKYICYDTKYITTNNDDIFTDYFYNKMKIMLCNIKGYFTCFSFAVFDSMTEYSYTIKNYKMFKELLEIKKKNIIFAEWTYKIDNYMVKIINNRTYIAYDHLMKYDKNASILIIENDKLIILPLFSEFY